jgi:AcrR family transcriptional regulator
MPAPKRARTGKASSSATDSQVRQRILTTASELFYRRGVRAVGIDEVIARAEVAKASLYHHFGTKDDLIAAFLEREDGVFWAQWDAVVEDAGPDAKQELERVLEWIGKRIARPGYRGCPQLNVAAEFADPAHPARGVARRHKARMRERLTDLSTRLGAGDPRLLAAQLALVIDGAFSACALQPSENSAPAFQGAIRTLVRQALRGGRP